MKIIPSLLTASAALAGVSQAATLSELVDAATGLCPELPTVIADNAAVLGTVLDAVGDQEIISALPDLTGQTINIFAPDDAAFADLLASVGATDLEDVDPQTVVDILKLHIAVAPQASKIGVTSLDGEPVTIRSAANQIIGGTSTSGINAGPLPESCKDVVNVFSIDKVLIPQAVADALAAAGAPALAPAAVGDDFNIDVSAPPPAPANNSTTVAQILARNRVKCPQVQSIMAEKAPILFSIVTANANSTMVDFPLPAEASSTFTFAPTDEAFGNLLDSLKVDLSQLTSDQVMSVLRLHAGGTPIGATGPKNFALEDVKIDVAGKTVSSGNSTAGIVEVATPPECPTTGVYIIDSVLLPQSIKDAIANATVPPAPAPTPSGGASSVSFGVAAVLAGVVTLFA